MVEILPVELETISSEEQFQRLAAREMPYLKRFAAVQTASADREDLLQKTLLRAWASRDQFRPDRGTLRNWLLAIMANESKRSWRNFGRDRPLVRLAEPEVPVEADLTDVRAAVDRLPRRQRQVIILFYYVDLSVEDVARVVGCSIGTVKSTLHDARRRLEEALKSYGTKR